MKPAFSEYWEDFDAAIITGKEAIEAIVKRLDERYKLDSATKEDALKTHRMKFISVVYPGEPPLLGADPSANFTRESELRNNLLPEARNAAEEARLAFDEEKEEWSSCMRHMPVDLKFLLRDEIERIFRECNTTEVKFVELQAEFDLLMDSRAQREEAERVIAARAAAVDPAEEQRARDRDAIAKAQADLLVSEAEAREPRLRYLSNHARCVVFIWDLTQAGPDLRKACDAALFTVRVGLSAMKWVLLGIRVIYLFIAPMEPYFRDEFFNTISILAGTVWVPDPSYFWVADDYAAARELLRGVATETQGRHYVVTARDTYLRAFADVVPLTKMCMYEHVRDADIPNILRIRHLPEEPALAPPSPYETALKGRLPFIALYIRPFAPHANYGCNDMYLVQRTVALLAPGVPLRVRYDATPSYDIMHWNVKSTVAEVIKTIFHWAAVPADTNVLVEEVSASGDHGRSFHEHMTCNVMQLGSRMQPSLVVNGPIAVNAAGELPSYPYASFQFKKGAMAPVCRLLLELLDRPVMEDVSMDSAVVADAVPWLDAPVPIPGPIEHRSDTCEHMGAAWGDFLSLVDEPRIFEGCDCRSIYWGNSSSNVEDTESSYKELARHFHPDGHADDKEFWNAAFRVISDARLGPREHVLRRDRNELEHAFHGRGVEPFKKAAVPKPVETFKLGIDTYI